MRPSSSTWTKPGLSPLGEQSRPWLLPVARHKKGRGGDERTSHRIDVIDLFSEDALRRSRVEDLRETGPGQGDLLFPWLAETASLAEMRWFIVQEIGGEAGFEDLVALTQIRFSTTAKLELARNYWDEMGCGNRKGMHGPLLTDLGTALGVRAAVDTTVGSRWP